MSRVAPSPTSIARPDILSVDPYEHAAWNPALERLHANELPWRNSTDGSEAGLNRYPEPQPQGLVAQLAALYAQPAANVLVTRGSDEAIDLLTRAYCRAGVDQVLVCPPTFGMYGVAARIQGAGVVRVPLNQARGFQYDAAAVLAECTPTVKLVYVCSPNNPTGNLVPEETILHLAGQLAGKALLVVDEAYIEFAATPGCARHLPGHPWLVVLRTLSKAHGLAGARCGVVLAHAEVVALLRRIVEPYNLTQLSIEAVLRALQPAARASTAGRVAAVLDERARLTAALEQTEGVIRVWPSAANFLLVEFVAPQLAFDQACAAGLLVRDVRRQPGLERALRLTVGTPEQNQRLISALRTHSRSRPAHKVT
ncbi:MAG TPA: histidinol-phosphate transaminase [Steroidobacteraceae bacterium]|nr:histidinol-phosphate transaminase [Steroidobacteraceae bacterium]